jgi:hypothetical protein
MSLLSWADFHAQTKRTLGHQVSELVATRIQSPTSPMPPTGSTPLTAAEKATLLNWIDAGAPPAVGSGCDLLPGGGTVGPSGNAGTSGGGSTGTGNSPSAGGAFGYAGTGGTTPSGGSAGTSVGGTAGTGGYTGPTGPADCQETFELTAHGGMGDTDKTPFNVPSNAANAGNQYTCFYFDPPYKPDSQGLWFYPIIKNTSVLHHWLLYATDAKTHPSGTSAPCSAIEVGAYLVAGWAPGAPPTQLPPDVGLQMPTGPNGGLILEVHHFNNDPSVPQTDSSGVRFCTAAANTRPHTAGVHFTGSEGICLMPNSQQQVSGVCNPQTDKGDIHIVNVWPHMHKLATHQKVTITRADGSTEVLHDQPFDFNSQITYPKDVVIHPGDSLSTTCSFNNTTAEKVPFGENTQAEMCYSFVTAWPAGALAVDPTKIDIIQLIGAGIQQTRRCMNLTSIFDSCNGLADYPVVK